MSPRQLNKEGRDVGEERFAEVAPAKTTPARVRRTYYLRDDVVRQLDAACLRLGLAKAAGTADAPAKSRILEALIEHGLENWDAVVERARRTV